MNREGRKPRSAPAKAVRVPPEQHHRFVEMLQAGRDIIEQLPLSIPLRNGTGFKDKTALFEVVFEAVERDVRPEALALNTDSAPP